MKLFLLLASFIIININLVWASQNGRLLLSVSPNSNKLNKFADYINKTLPLSVKNKINQEIVLEFGEVSGINDNNFKNVCSGKLKITSHNEAFKSLKITVDKYFNNEQKLGTAPLELNLCKFKTYQKLIEYHIVHELMHVIDENYKYSREPSFLSTAGWISRGLFFPTRNQLNQKRISSPDLRELENAAESFATNSALYLIDQNFKCHRPSLYKYLSHLFQAFPFKSQVCDIDRIVTLSNGMLDMEKSLTDDRFVELDSKRIYQIHYLLADKGDAIESKFGHSMFRLVFCKKDVPLGPDCLKDSSAHVIASFRADMTGSGIDYLKGLNGGYPSQIFFYKMDSILEEYTKGERRSIKSIPINLSVEQMEIFIDKLLEINWSYLGKYYFITNNCATESMNLLKAVLGDSYGVQDTVINTPKGIYKFLKKVNLTDASLFNDLEAARIAGYYFPSISTQIDKSLKYLKIENTNLDDFLHHNNAIERKNIYHNIIENSPSKEKVKLAANAIKIENIALLNEKLFINKKEISNKNVTSEVTREDQNSKDFQENFHTKLKKINDYLVSLSSVPVYPHSYGIPLKNEVVRLPANIIAEEFNRLTEDLHIYAESNKDITVVKNNAHELYSEYYQIEDNKKYLNEIIVGKRNLQ